MFAQLKEKKKKKNTAEAYNSVVWTEEGTV